MAHHDVVTDDGRAEGKVAQYDEADQAAKHSKATKLLTEWGLSQYTEIMQDEGWDEPELWDCITDDTFQNVLHFKSGHIAKFKSKLAKWKDERSQDCIPIIIKLVLLGDCRVGKSSIILRFVKNEFDQYKFPTVGATFLTQSVYMDGYMVKYEIWDTAGQEKYRALAPLYYRGALCALAVYDITNSESFENAERWINEVRTQEGNQVIIALAGNKVDLAVNRTVSKEEAVVHAKRSNYIFYETSAKTSENIKKVFTMIAREAVKRARDGRMPKKKEHKNIIVEPEPASEARKNKCCLLL